MPGPGPGEDLRCLPLRPMALAAGWLPGRIGAVVTAGSERGMQWTGWRGELRW